MPDDQMERMRNQSNRIGTANLSRAADIAAEGLTQMRGATAPRLILELICGRILLPIGDNSEAGLLSRIERLERAENIAPLTSSAASAPARTVEAKEKAAPLHSTEALSSPKETEEVTILNMNKLKSKRREYFILYFKWANKKGAIFCKR
jgi:DNA polymerase-3 subunit gamma/tau